MKKTPFPYLIWRTRVTYLLSFPFTVSPDAEYDVEFKTSAEENAGTDANVYFQMIGEDGETQEIDLKNKGKGYFHRGQLDRFRIRARDVGRVSERVNTSLFLRMEYKNGAINFFLPSSAPKLDRLVLVWLRDPRIDLALKHSSCKCKSNLRPIALMI